MRNFTKMLIFIGLIWSSMVFTEVAQGHSYIIRVQEERHSTRWTLTEWLRIKERMRMMDLWLALFSNPKHDTFRPEFSLTYGVLNGLTSYKNGAEVTGLTQSSQVMKGQIWLTNLITTATRFRTLNIDLGIEAAKRQSAQMGFVSGVAPTQEVLDETPTQQHWAAAFRIFGKHIQDSSLILKYGQYDYPDHLAWGTNPDQSLHGTLAGAEMSLYLLKWLGLEGNYLKFGNEKSLQSGPIQGTYADTLGFIEISLIRFMFGSYVETWQVERDNGEQRVDSVGVFSGAKLQF